MRERPEPDHHGFWRGKVGSGVSSFVGRFFALPYPGGVG
jgi:hypothetical protein